MTLLHQAVIENHVDLVRQLKNSPKVKDREKNGFTPLELALLLGRRECQEILQDAQTSLKSFKAELNHQRSPISLSISEFEKTFKITYRPFLTFPSYSILEDVIDHCPYLFKLEAFVNSGDKWEVSYQAQLLAGNFADTMVRWIDPQVGYGVFAAADLPKRSFIGEYTGVIRQVDLRSPNLNGYCFQYPPRFISSKHFVIDAQNEGNIARFINHSTQPNVQPLWLLNRRSYILF